MFGALKRKLSRHLLRDPEYAFLFEPPPDEVVSIDCETTGLNVRKDDIVTVAAIKIRGNRILTSETFEAAVKPRRRSVPTRSRCISSASRTSPAGAPMTEVLPGLLRFIGSRPLVGFYLEFDVAMLNKHVRRMIGIDLPNRANRGLRRLLRPQVPRRAHRARRST